MKRVFTALLTLLCGFGAARAAELCDSTEVFYRQGQSVLDTAFCGNAARLAALKGELADTSYIYTRVHVVGAASPEGGVAVNERLSRRRAASIFDYFSSRGLPHDVPTTFTYEGRDWRGLRAMVEADAAVPERAGVLEVLNSIIATVKRTGHDSAANLVRIKTFAGGVPYKYMYRNMFPRLRMSRIYVDYEPREHPMPEVFAAPRMRMALPEPAAAAPEAVPEAVAPQVVAESPRPFYMALKTNMLYDALAIPAVGAEFYVGRGWSVGASWMYGWWDCDRRHRYWRAYGGDVYARRWFGRAAVAKPLTGHHLGVFAGAFIFDFEWGGKGYMGGRPGHTLWDRCMHMAGIEYGYSLPVARRLNIDFSIGIGYIGGKYREYKPCGGCYMWQATKRLHWFGPAKAEISLVWLIGRGNTNW